MPFFVELPADEYGNRAFTNSFPCVVEGHIVGEGRSAELVFDAPKEIASKWHSVLIGHYGGWMEVPGPARRLERDERERLIAQETDRKIRRL